MSLPGWFSIIKKERSKKFCNLVGCINVRALGVTGEFQKYCSEHRRKFYTDKIINEVLQTDKCRYRLIRKFTRSLINFLKRGEITREEAKEELFEIVSSIFALDPSYDSTLLDTFDVNLRNFPGIHKHLKHIAIRKEVETKILRYLLRYPLTFQVSKVEEFSESLHVSLFAKLNNILEGDEGYLDSTGKFIPRIWLVDLLKRAYRNGHNITIVVDSNGFRQAKVKELTAEELKEALLKKRLHSDFGCDLDKEPDESDD